MRNVQFFIILSVLLAGSMDAQEFRVISAKGEVQFFMDAPDNAKKVNPGQKLNAKGKLILESGESIRILCKDKPHHITSIGTHDLWPLYESSNKKSMSYTSRFWNFVVEGLKSSDSPDDLKAYHASNLSVSGGIKGYSASSCSNKEAQWSCPISGNIRNLVVSIVTENMEADSLVLFRGESRVALYNGDMDEVDLAPHVNPASEEVFKLKMYSKDCMISKELRIKDYSDVALDQRLESISGWEDASDMDKRWMRATVLEMKGYQSEAYLIYQDLMKEDPNNELVSRLFNLFLVRNNLTPISN